MSGTQAPNAPDLGVCQWFHFQDADTLERCVRLMHDLGVRHLRTGISWADFVRPAGQDWYDRQMETLAQFDVLLSVWHTPPSLGEAPSCAAPPRRLKDYADFIDLVITRYGGLFTDLELWNEPNNRLKWDFARFDPDWRKFGEMIAMAAHWAQRRGKCTVLGGMIPVDAAWLGLMSSHGALAFIDVVAIHGFPGMWWADAPNWDWHSHWHGWGDKVARVRPLAGPKPVWITETGLATVDLATNTPARHDLQVEMLRQAARAPVERVYWYSLIDLDPARDAIEGFHVDENEYHLGLVTWDGRPKPAFDVMRQLQADRLDRGPSPSHRAAPAGP
ncbi:MAG TPA: hypothetical protein VFF69_15895 [Phycisphaerales bacterium]|nr:hypothetical protein [Phycisphaerales bacterium]